MASASTSTIKFPMLSTPTEIAQLPPELIDAIIQLLRDDQASLKTCALVCRSWVPISRHYFPLQLVLNHRNLKKASRILLGETSTIASSIQHLILDEIGDWHQVHDEHLNLCRLKQITFYNTLQTVRWYLLPRSFDHLLHNLESLCLDRVHFPSPSALFDLLRHAPQLQSLSCLMALVDKEAHGPLLTDSDELLPKLKSLQLHNCYDTLLHFFMERWTVSGPPFTTLDLDDCSGLKFEMYLPALGWSLQVLRFSTRPRFLLEIAPRFTFLTQLRSLSLDYSGYYPSRINMGLEFVINALSNLTSPHFQELIITFGSEKCGSLNLNTWSELNSLLESPRFSPTLRTLTFRFQEGWFKRSHRTIRARERWIEKRFPTYAKRGILGVVQLW